MKEIKEAEVLNEKDVIKPELPDVKAEISNIAKIEDNIAEVKEKALKIKKFYSNYVVDEAGTKIAKGEITTINKAIEKVDRYRIDLTKEYNKPLEKFTADAKEVVTILNEAKTTIDIQVKKFESEKIEKATEECKNFFDEYRQLKNISFVQYTDMNQKVGLSDITDKGSIKKAKTTEIEKFIDKIENDLNTIETMEYSKDILVEYMKDKDLNRSITEIQNRKAKEEALNNELVTPKAEINPKPKNEFLSAPTIGIDMGEEKSVEVAQASFKVTTTMEKLKKLVEYMKAEGINYEQIKSSK